MNNLVNYTDRTFTLITSDGEIWCQKHNPIRMFNPFILTTKTPLKGFPCYVYEITEKVVAAKSIPEIEEGKEYNWVVTLDVAEVLRKDPVYKDVKFFIVKDFTVDKQGFMTVYSLYIY